jgi:hypothetical protein
VHHRDALTTQDALRGTRGQKFAHVPQRLSVTSELIYRDVHHSVRNPFEHDTDSRTGSGQIVEKLPMNGSG